MCLSMPQARGICIKIDQFMRLLIVCLLIACKVSGQGEIYSIQCQTLDSNVLSLQQLAGRKILILVTDVTKPDRDLIRKLDSMSAEKGKIAVLIAAVFDLGTKISIKDAETMRTEYKGNVFVLSPSYATKKSAGKQDQLFRWLTTVQQNGHFNYDVMKTGQMFLVNERGDLVAVLSEGAPFSLVADILGDSEINASK